MLMSHEPLLEQYERPGYKPDQSHVEFYNTCYQDFGGYPFSLLNEVCY